MPPNVIVLVNGSPQSVQAPRARALFDDAVIIYKERGRLGSLGLVRRALCDVEEGWIYCIDLGFPSSLLAMLRRRLSTKIKLIYEIGDPARALLANQARSTWEISVAHGFDKYLPRRADRLVFRGSYLADYFGKLCGEHSLPDWLWLPDGVDGSVFKPLPMKAVEIAALRTEHRLDGKFVIGLVGNIHYNPIHNLFYGWELAEALALLPPELPIVGVIVGDGPGRKYLEATRDRLKLGDRLRLIGRVEHPKVPLWMNLFDVALSTQTDDPVGWGRTTAKLPEYLACGTPVLCTDVGEAHRLLKDSGQTLPYRGMRDSTYPARLAERLRELMTSDTSWCRAFNRQLAERLFDYRILKKQIDDFIAAA